MAVIGAGVRLVKSGTRVVTRDLCFCSIRARASAATGALVVLLRGADLPSSAIAAVSPGDRDTPNCGAQPRTRLARTGRRLGGKARRDCHATANRCQQRSILGPSSSRPDAFGPRAARPPRRQGCCRRSCHAVRDVSGIAPAAFSATCATRRRLAADAVREWPSATPPTRPRVPRRPATAAAGMGELPPRRWPSLALASIRRVPPPAQTRRMAPSRGRSSLTLRSGSAACSPRCPLAGRCFLTARRADGPPRRRGTVHLPTAFPARLFAWGESAWQTLSAMSIPAYSGASPTRRTAILGRDRHAAPSGHRGGGNAGAEPPIPERSAATAIIVPPEHLPCVRVTGLRRKETD